MLFPTNNREHSSLPDSNAPVYFAKNTAPKSFVASVPGLVRGDGGALDADVELLDGVGAIDRNLLIFFVVKNYEQTVKFHLHRIKHRRKKLGTLAKAVSNYSYIVPSFLCRLKLIKIR